MKKSPGAGGGTGVLASHQEGDHDVGNFAIVESPAILVRALIHKSTKHVEFTLQEKRKFAMSNKE